MCKRTESLPETFIVMVRFTAIEVGIAETGTEAADTVETDPASPSAVEAQECTSTGNIYLNW